MPLPSQPTIGDLIGAAIRESCERAGWSQREFAGRLGTNQSAVRRLMASGLASLDVALTTRALKELGLRVTIDLGGPELATRPRQRDRVHAWCVAYVVRRLRGLGFDVRTEVEIGDGRSRGWIDLLAFRHADRLLLCIEIKTVIDDLGRIVRRLGWHVRNARAAAAGLGWQSGTLVPLLLTLRTEESESRLASAAEVIRSELPGTAGEVLAWLAPGSSERPRPSTAFIDPRRRARTWLIRPRIQGGRSRPLYRDYADAARALTTPRARPR